MALELREAFLFYNSFHSREGFEIYSPTSFLVLGMNGPSQKSSQIL